MVKEKRKWKTTAKVRARIEWKIFIEWNENSLRIMCVASLVVRHCIRLRFIVLFNCVGMCKRKRDKWWNLLFGCYSMNNLFFSSLFYYSYVFCFFLVWNEMNESQRKTIFNVNVFVNVFDIHWLMLNEFANVREVVKRSRFWQELILFFFLTYRSICRTFLIAFFALDLI